MNEKEKKQINKEARSLLDSLKNKWTIIKEDYDSIIEQLNEPKSRSLMSIEYEKFLTSKVKYYESFFEELKPVTQDISIALDEELQRRNKSISKNQ